MRRIYATTNRPSRIYFNEWDSARDESRIDFLGIEGAPEEDTTISQGEWKRRSHYPQSLVPASPLPYTQYNEPWYYTSCRMEDVAEITCCVGKVAPETGIIGMLICYANGGRACLGQYRVDWTQDPIRVDPAGALRVGMGKTTKGFPFVASVGTTRGPESGRSLRWLDIPWRGRLEWWFSQRQCRLNHSD